MATPGHRVRVLLEFYDAELSGEDAQTYADLASRMIAQQFPGAAVISYVEANPPADELT